MVKVTAVLMIIPLAACAPGEGSEAGGQGTSAASPAMRAAAHEPAPDTAVSNLDPPPAARASAAPSSKCPVTASHGWNAAVIGKPPDAGDRLRVSGTVAFAEGGYRARLERGAVLEIHPPIQQVELEIERTSASAPRAVEVRGEFPALNDYGAIVIRCGGRTLATIDSVVWTERAIMEDGN